MDKSNNLICGIMADHNFCLARYFYAEKIDFSETRLKERQGDYSFIYETVERDGHVLSNRDRRDWYCSNCCHGHRRIEKYWECRRCGGDHKRKHPCDEEALRTQQIQR